MQKAYPSKVFYMELNQQFAQLLREERKKRGLTQQELASILGMGQGNVSMIERGEWNVSLDIVERIARALDMDVELSMYKKSSLV